MYANEFVWYQQFFKKKIKNIYYRCQFWKKKVVSKRGMTAVSIMHFFSLLSPKTVIGLTISCVRKEEDSQSNENDDQSNRNFPTVDIATLTKRVTHFVLYISV